MVPKMHNDYVTPKERLKLQSRTREEPDGDMVLCAAVCGLVIIIVMMSAMAIIIALE